jgi:hypothetical protein
MGPNNLGRRIYFVIAAAAVLAVFGAIVINGLWEYWRSSEAGLDLGLVGRVVKYSITAVGLTGTTLWILNWVSKRFPKVFVLLGIPNFSGRWEGWRYSTYSNEWLPLCVEINQSLLRVATASYMPNVITHSLASTIIKDESEPLAKLTIVYRADPESYGLEESTHHWGAMILRLTMQNQIEILEGQYFTDRKRSDGHRGTQGVIRLQRASRALSAHLDLRDDWAMPKPANPPGHYPRV